MLYSRREALDLFLDMIGHTGDAGARNLAENLLNLAVSRIYRRHPWQSMILVSPYEFSTVADTRSYGLPPWFGRITGKDGQIRNLTDGSVIAPITLEELQAVAPEAGTSLETAGRPQRYLLVGTSPVTLQPSTSGDALEWISDGASDITVRALVEGLNGNGVWTQTQVTLTGTAAVAAGTWKEIYRASKAYPEGVTPTTELSSSEGTVTLRKVTGGTTIVSLLPDETAKELPQLTLWPKPNDVFTIAVPGVRKPIKLTRDADVLPDDWLDAVLEEMNRRWRIADGDAPERPMQDGPALVDLICADNASMAQLRRWRTPFSG